MVQSQEEDDVIAKDAGRVHSNLRQKAWPCLKPWILLIAFSAVALAWSPISLQTCLPFRMPPLLPKEHSELAELQENFFFNSKVFALCWFFFLVSCRNTRGDCLKPNNTLCAKERDDKLQGLLDDEPEPRIRTKSWIDETSHECVHTVRSYLDFLWTSFWLFVVLTIISTAIVGPVWGIRPLLGLNSIHHSHSTTFQELKAIGIASAGISSSRIENMAMCKSDPSAEYVKIMNRTDINQSVCVLHSDRERNCSKSEISCGASRIGALLHAHSAVSCARAAEHRLAVVVAYEDSTRRCCTFQSKDDEGAKSEALLSLQSGSHGEASQFIVCFGSVNFWNTRVIFWLTVMYGVIMLFFAFAIHKRTMKDSTDWEQRTVWCTEVPVRDNDDGSPFILDVSRLDRVGEHIHQAAHDRINFMLSQRYKDHPFLSEVLQQRKISEVRVGRYISPAKAGRESPDYCLSGHAFIITSRKEYADLLLTRESWHYFPWFLMWRDHSILKIIIPPMASVSLRCRRAPPSSDIVWENLHLHPRWITERVLFVILFVIMTVLVAPKEIVEMAKHGVEQIKHHFDALGKSEKMWTALEADGGILSQLPSLWLTTANYVLLPLFIYYLSAVRRHRQASLGEEYEFVHNLSFLIIFSIIVPLTTDQHSLLQSVVQKLNVPSTEMLAHFAKQSFEVSGSLFIKYVTNAAFVTGGTQLILFGQTFLRWFCCCWCCCSGWEAPEFPWGYWYAWAVSILAMCVMMSVTTPVLLPLGAVFFLIKYYVDHTNLTRRAFSTVVKLDRKFTFILMVTLVQVVSLFWLNMSAFFFAQGTAAFDEFLQLPQVDFCNKIEPCPMYVFSRRKLIGTSLWLPEFHLPEVVVRFGKHVFIMFMCLCGMFSARKHGSVGLFFQHSTLKWCPPKTYLRFLGQILPLTAFGVPAFVFLYKAISSVPGIRWVSISTNRYCAWILLWMSLLVFVSSLVMQYVTQRLARCFAPLVLDDAFMDGLLKTPVQKYNGQAVATDVGKDYQHALQL
eukprot:TRINITY_DN15746_c0_g1_i1.p1 TRINITY_DN15746_c0_g1~~TRINITY_DN15746_c0_g1_i1.p1  ORF type:complete len:1015 (-),score=94.63 TRINITY_DN15746_c0_g1_i1:222-3266(-)